LIQIEIVRF